MTSPAWLDRLPEQMVDPHVHQWDPLTTPRVVSREARLVRRVERIPRSLGRLLPQADREFAGDPHHLLKPYLPATYAADARPLPIGQVVHIEAKWPVAEDHLAAVQETRWLLGLPFGRDGLPELGAVVVSADPRWHDAAQVLDAHLAATDKVRGVRLTAAHHPDPGVRDFCESPALFSEPAFLDGFEAVAARGLSFELWCYSHQLPSALELVRRYPEATFVLDHHGTPVGLLGPRGRHTARYEHQRRELLAPWREDVAALAEHPNVVAKHSGLGMPVLGDQRPHELTTDGLAGADELLDTLAPVISHVQECFGPERTMWASNFPIDKPSFSLPATLGLLVEVLGESLDLTALTRDVARRVYRLSPTSA